MTIPACLLTDAALEPATLCHVPEIYISDRDMVLEPSNIIGRPAGPRLSAIGNTRLVHLDYLNRRMSAQRNTPLTSLTVGGVKDCLCLLNLSRFYYLQAHESAEERVYEYLRGTRG